jgi:hypothetical protein
VLAAGAVLTVLGSVLAWPRRDESRARDQARSPGARFPAACMCVMALGFAIWNGSHAAQHVAIGRDAGVYAVTGKWLATHGDLEVPAIPVGATTASAASLKLPGTYVEDGNRLEFQFNHLMPTLLAEAHGLGGDRLMFRVPALLGALALLAVYAVGCRFVRRPWLVLAAVGALALSLPQLNVSRDTYSESSVELLLWAGLWLTLTAYRRRSSRRSIGLAVLAGAALGGTLLSRVDAFAFLIPLPVLGAMALLLARSRADRRQLGRLYLGLLIGAVPMGSLGTFDVIERAGHYYPDLSRQIHLLRVAMVVSLLLSIVLLAVWPLLARHGTPLARWAAARQRSLAVGSALILVVGLLTAWLVRPLGRHELGQSFALIGVLQARAGLAVEPRRTYSEHSISWISWYLGPITVTLAIIGAAVVVASLWRRLDSARVLVVGVAGFASVIYLWKPSVVPDQIWAMRRFVPATLPLLVLLSATAIAALAQITTRSAAGTIRQRTVLTVGAAGMLVFPVATVRPVASFEPQVGALTLVQSLCRTVGPQSAVVFAAKNPGSLSLTTAVRTLCNVPVAILTRAQTSVETEQLARAWQTRGRTLWVVGSSATAIARSASGTTSRLVARTTSPRELEMTVQRAPQAYSPNVFTVYAGPVVTL